MINYHEFVMQILEHYVFNVINPVSGSEKCLLMWHTCAFFLGCWVKNLFLVSTTNAANIPGSFITHH